MKDVTKIYFDMEFTGPSKDTTVISLGMCTDNDNVYFYAELTDYNEDQVNDWIQTNVLDNLYLPEDGRVTQYNNRNELMSIDIKGNRDKVYEAAKKWLDQFDLIEWVADCCHYDFVLLIDLIYGHALNMPYGKHCAACHDINQDIADYFNITELEAFDKSREELIDTFDKKVIGNKHNALYDAKVTREIYKEIEERKNNLILL